MSLRIFVGTASKGEAGRYGYCATLNFKGTEKDVCGVITMATEKQAALASVLAACQALKRQVDMEVLFSDKELVSEAQKCFSDKVCPQNKSERDSKLWTDMVGHSFYHNMTASFAEDTSPEMHRAAQAALRALEEEDSIKTTSAAVINIGLTHVTTDYTGGYAIEIQGEDGTTKRVDGLLSGANTTALELHSLITALKGIPAGAKISIHTSSTRLVSEINKRITNDFTTHINDGNNLWPIVEEMLPEYRLELIQEEKDSPKLEEVNKRAKDVLYMVNFLTGKDSKLHESVEQRLS